MQLILHDCLNPQLIRELKGRLISRNVTLSVGLSLLAQLVIFLAFISQIPAPDAQHGAYCIYQENNPCIVNWIQWKEDLNQVFYWVLPWVLVCGGVYLLIADLAREERRGTLNFIRVSPQSSQSILMGKLLGVPVLLFLAVAISLPSYAATAIMAQIPLLEVWSFYVILAALCAVFYSAAALFALMGGHQALVGAGVTLGMLFWLMHQEWYSYGKGWSTDQWFGFILNGDNLFNVRLFALVNCVMWTYWIWQGLYRRFRNPAATMISKKQSYALVFCVNVLFLGLVTSYLGSESDPKLEAYLGLAEKKRNADVIRLVEVLPGYKRQ
ncbi:ABC transporter permease, partial [Laspinema sp. D3]|nr:ABC transporter permease [Laspinema sp. D2c]